MSMRSYPLWVWVGLLILSLALAVFAADAFAVYNTNRVDQNQCDALEYLTQHHLVKNPAFNRGLVRWEKVDKCQD